jgi:hypothetical protein
MRVGIGPIGGMRARVGKRRQEASASASARSVVVHVISCVQHAYFGTCTVGRDTVIVSVRVLRLWLCVSWIVGCSRRVCNNEKASAQRSKASMLVPRNWNGYLRESRHSPENRKGIV